MIEIHLNPVQSINLQYERVSAEELYRILESDEYRLRDFTLRSLAGRLIYPSPATEIASQDTVSVSFRLNGGKGGFGKNLKRQGNKLGKRVTNFDDCRDLSGRRLRVLNEAKLIADYDELERKLEKEKQERLQKRIQDGLNPPSKAKVLFDDVEFTRSKDQMRDSIRGAVFATLLGQQSTGQESPPASSSSTKTNTNVDKDKSSKAATDDDTGERNVKEADDDKLSHEQDN